MYIGRFNEYGYEVVHLNAGIPVYSAGNSKYDSQQVVPPEEGLSLETIREYCEQTTREIAKENNGVFGGTEYDDVEYPGPPRDMFGNDLTKTDSFGSKRTELKENNG